MEVYFNCRLGQLEYEKQSNTHTEMESKNSTSCLFSILLHKIILDERRIIEPREAEAAGERSNFRLSCLL